MNLYCSNYDERPTPMLWGEHAFRLAGRHRRWCLFAAPNEAAASSLITRRRDCLGVRGVLQNQFRQLPAIDCFNVVKAPPLPCRMADTDEDGGAWPVQTVYDEVRGDGLAASRHIHRGEAVLRVAPLVAVPCSTSAARRCATCLAALGSTPGGAASSPCGHCGVAVLCGRCAAVGARGAALHGDECDAWALLARGLGPAGECGREPH